MIGVETSGNRIIEEPRFGETQLKVAACGTGFRAQQEILTAAGKSRPVRDVEIFLFDFNEPDQGLGFKQWFRCGGRASGG